VTYCGIETNPRAQYYTKTAEEGVRGSVRLTDNDVVPDLVDQVDRPIRQVSADGAYDKRKCYEASEKTGAQVTIPPRRDAKIWQHGNSTGAPWQRDENLRAIRRSGRKQRKTTQVIIGGA
jgi:hypothetical protein